MCRFGAPCLKETRVPADIAPFHAISISRLAHQLQVAGKPVIHMEFGQPSTGAPEAAIARAHAVLDSDPMGYWENPALKARIARHYRDAYGVVVDPEQIILTCGASPALVMSFAALFSPGDRVALARPGYVAYRNTLKALHLVPVEISCGPETHYQLTAAQIAALDPAPQGVIVASPANPTGSMIPDDEFARIAALCDARGIRLVSDEIYHGLTYAGRARSALEFTTRAHVINSFSKYYSMVAWRLGWLLVPPDEVALARAYMGNLFLTPPSLSQHAALVTMDEVATLEGHWAVYARNRALLLEALPRLGLKSIAPPDGAFYIYADIGHLTQDSMAFCEQLLRDTFIATAPGIDFDPEQGHRFMRFSFAVSEAETREAIARLEGWLPRMDSNHD
jgi:aspartate/methionine/tyrosine aminotransferase